MMEKPTSGTFGMRYRKLKSQQQHNRCNLQGLTFYSKHWRGSCEAAQARGQFDQGAAEGRRTAWGKPSCL